MHLTFCLCSLNSFIDNGVMAFLRVLELLGFQNSFLKHFPSQVFTNSTILQIVHRADLSENYFLIVLNYIIKVKIANCRVYKGGVIT